MSMTVTLEHGTLLQVVNKVENSAWHMVYPQGWPLQLQIHANSFYANEYR